MKNFIYNSVIKSRQYGAEQLCSGCVLGNTMATQSCVAIQVAIPIPYLPQGPPPG